MSLEIGREELRAILAVAEEKLRSARHSLAGGYCADAASRAYYAAFHAITAVLAGADMLCLSNNPMAAVNVPGFKADPDLPGKAIAILSRAVGEGRLPAARVAQAYDRIVQLKRRLSAAGRTPP